MRSLFILLTPKYLRLAAPFQHRHGLRSFRSADCVAALVVSGMPRADYSIYEI